MTEPVPGDSNRWRGYAHKDLYLMLHDGPGATASAEPSRRWAEIAATLTEVGQDLQTALDLTGAGWQGKAAGAAYSRLSTTVAWATESGTSAAGMRTSVEDQADHIARARADMPRPEDVPAPDPTAPPVVQVVDAQTDAEPAEAAASSAEERAVEVMTAYETNTNATTATLPAFEAPEKLKFNSGVHQGQGVGLIGGLTSAAGLGGSRNHQDEHRRDDRPRGGGSGGTHTSGAEFQQTRHRSVPQPLAQGRMMGVSGDPFFAMGAVDGDRTQERRPGRSTTAVGGGSGGGGGGGAPGPRGGLPGAPGHELQAAQQAQQAAAASQAAAHPGAPMAPGAAGAAGGPDKMAMRKLGMDAIGSSQWFGDPEEPVPGQSQKRRFDLRDSAEPEEPASILDDEHQLPPNVIGEGGR